MRSIRDRLLVWLLSGVVLLFAAAGCCIFYTVRHVLFSEVEEELQRARKVVYNAYENQALEPGIFLKGPPRGRRPRFRDEQRWREFDYENGELIYRLKLSDGQILLKSPSLGDRFIESAPSDPEQRKSVALKLSDGSMLRARIDHANHRKWPALTHGKDPDRESSIEIVVARDISGIRKRLLLLAAGICGVVISAAAMAGLLISLAIRRGLSPLNQLAREAAQVDANTLTARFNNSELPQELHPISERLNDLMARLEHSFERERRFSSDLAHELRTPIAEVASMAEAAKLFPDRIPEDQFERILETAQRMQKMVEDLLILARSEQGAPELSFEEIRLAELTSACWKPFSEKAENRDLSVSIEVEQAQTLTTDPGLFSHILTNLFSNAVEYTPVGGKIKIECLRGSDGANRGLSVSNSAGDLTQCEVDHLFDRFWRQDASRSGNGHSGLGLSLARECAAAVSFDLSAELSHDMIQFNLARRS